MGLVEGGAGGRGQLSKASAGVPSGKSPFAGDGPVEESSSKMTISEKHVGYWVGEVDHNSGISRSIPPESDGDIKCAN